MIRTHIFKATQPRSLLDDLNHESGRIYTSVVVEHWRIMRKSDVWLKPSTQERYNDFLYPDCTLHAHSRDAAQQGFAKACKTIKALKKSGNETARYPYKRKYWRTTIWKNTGIRVKDGVALLARARGLEPVGVALPDDIRASQFVEARLVFNRRSARYEWHFVVDDGVEVEMRKTGVAVAVDMGEIHPAACASETAAEVISCRQLRAVAQGFNKAQAEIVALRSKCKRGSRRHKKLSRALAQARTKRKYRLRDALHKVSRAVVEFADAQNADTVVMGDVRDIADKTDKGKRQNQKLSNWPHGMLRGYIEYKALALGIATVLQEEAYTSQTCPGCGERQKPRGRVYTCKCGFVGHRDGQVGAPNILSKHLFGECGRVRISNPPKYRHPLLAGKRSRADTAHVARANEKPPRL